MERAADSPAASCRRSGQAFPALGGSGAADAGIGAGVGALPAAFPAARRRVPGGPAAASGLARRTRRPNQGFTLIELLIVVTIIGITVVLSTFSVTVFDDFKLTEQANKILDQIVQCREEAIYLSSVCTVHIENAKTKREITETLLGKRVRIGGVEYRHTIVPYKYKITTPEDATFDIYNYEQSSDSELDLTYARNIDPSGEKDPLLKQGVISYYPDASYTAFVLKYELPEIEQTVYIYGDGNSLPETSSENPLLTY